MVQTLERDGRATGVKVISIAPLGPAKRRYARGGAGSSGRGHPAFPDRGRPDLPEADLVRLEEEGIIR